MKYLILTALLLAALPARAGLVAEFLFDGDVQDSSGNANHALFLTGSFPSFGTFTTGRDGTPNGALLFNGTNQYLNIAHTSGLPLTQHTDFTITGWVKGPANQTDKRIFSEGSASAFQPLYNLGTDLAGTNGKLAIFIRDDGNNILVSHHQPAGTLYDDTWHHFTVIDRNGTLSVYIDGVLQTGSPTYTRVPLTANTTTLGGILRATPGNFFAGALDDVRFYDSADINLTVTNTNDSGPGSLREAITLAPDGATITFDPTTLDGQTITLTSGQLLLDKDLTIDASALSGGLTISGNANANGTLDPGESRIFEVTSGKTVVLRALRLIKGQASTTAGNKSAAGGAIQTQGNLTLDRCLVTDCRAQFGGGIDQLGGTLTITRSTLSGNSAQFGGGIYASGGFVEITQSTLSGNSASSNGGGIYRQFGAITITRSIVAGNSASSNPNIDGPVTDNGSNLLSGNPLLAPLGDYGGPTPTMPPLPGSPAIDAALGFPGATDQRGLPIGDYVYENDFATADLGGATVFTNIADLLSPPVQPETGTVADGSFLFTGEVSNQVAALVLPAPPEAFTTFAASFDLSYTDPSEGTGSGGPADGISFSFGAAPAANTFGGASGANAENGVPGMHRITLNTASFGGSPTFLRYIGPGNTTIASAPIDRFGDAGKVLPITVTLDATGKLTVTYKGELAFTVPNIGYTHAPGDTFTFGARTGGDVSEQRVDNIRIATNLPGGAPDIGAVELQQVVVLNNNDTGPGSLREALTATPGQAEVITFDPAFFNGQPDNTITVGSHITVTNNVTVDARPIAEGVTLSGGGPGQILRINGSNGSPAVALHGLTLTNGNSIVGGAIDNSDATLALSRCTLSANTAVGFGGAIFSGGPGASLILDHCTLTGNTSSLSAGGAISASGTLILRHCTVTNNSASSGGGIRFPQGIFTLENSIVTDNRAGGDPDAPSADITNGGTLTRVGANIVRRLQNSTSPMGTDTGPPAIHAAPQLAPFGDYGGPTFTMPPLPGSPAIDAASDSLDLTDQRGFLRPVDGDGNTTAIADIGAAEFTPATDLALFFGLDTDGDGNPFGVEFALGTDPNLSDPGNPRNLRLLPQPAGPMTLTFGRNQAAQPFMIWRLTRSTTLLPGSFTEIFRYDGPTGTFTNNGTNAVISSTSFAVTDNSPPPGKAFYRFEAVPAP